MNNRKLKKFNEFKNEDNLINEKVSLKTILTSAMIALSSLTSHAETVTDVEQTELIQNDIQDLEQQIEALKIKLEEYKKIDSEIIDTEIIDSALELEPSNKNALHEINNILNNIDKDKLDNEKLIEAYEFLRKAEKNPESFSKEEAIMIIENLKDVDVDESESIEVKIFHTILILILLSFTIVFWRWVFKDYKMYGFGEYKDQTHS